MATGSQSLVCVFRTKQLNKDLMHVLHRPVESTAQSGHWHKKIKLAPLIGYYQTAYRLMMCINISEFGMLIHYKKMVVMNG